MRPPVQTKPATMKSKSRLTKKAREVGKVALAPATTWGHRTVERRSVYRSQSDGLNLWKLNSLWPVQSRKREKPETGRPSSHHLLPKRHIARHQQRILS